MDSLIPAGVIHNWYIESEKEGAWTVERILLNYVSGCYTASSNRVGPESPDRMFGDGG